MVIQFVSQISPPSSKYSLAQHPAPHHVPQRAWLVTLPVTLNPRGDKPLQIQDTGVEPAQHVPLKPSPCLSPESRREPDMTRNSRYKLKGSLLHELI